LFPDPNLEQRVAYCHFWQKKLSDNKEIEFPDKLCKAIAGITDDFSFAYIQEAFVAALLAIARTKQGVIVDYQGQTPKSGDEWVDIMATDGGEGDGLDTLILWIEIKKQVAILREGMDPK
jgi:hypothetical protein